MARCIFIMLFAWATFAVAFGQSRGMLTGKVVDDEGRPLVGATIRLEGTATGGLSKAPDGRFMIAGISPGDYVVVVSAIGVSEPVRRSVRIVSGSTFDVGTIALGRGTISGREVVVRADKSVEREQVTTTRTITSPEDRRGYAPTTREVSRESMERSPRTSVVDVVPMRRDTKGENGIDLRRGRATETSIRVDGVEVTDPYMGGFGSTAAGIYPSVSTLDAGAIVADTAQAVVQPADDRSRENYATIYENPFRAAHVNPMSTFSIDVDRAAYSNMRRFLSAGQMPPADAVRIEELVNYFDYSYPDPTDEHPFRIETEMTECPWDRSHRLVRVGLQGRRLNTDAMPPSNLVFLIDVSGSMQGLDRLELVKRGLGILVAQLRPEDNVAIVVYAGAAGLVLPMTSGADKHAIANAIEGLSAGGSTAGGEGINLAYKVALDHFRTGGNNRVILATDGDFNVGVSSEQELVALIEEKRKHGVFLTVLGFGTGNYQDAKMEQLADKGNGNYAYVDDIAEAKKVFGSELGGTLLTIAKDVKIQVAFAPERVESYRLIGYENRMLATEDFDDDLKDAGELGAGHTVTALYEIVPRGARSASLDGWVGRPDTLDMPGDWKDGEMMRVRLRYKLPDSDVSTLIEGPVIDRGVGITSASEDFRFAAAVAQFGLLLRNSTHKGSSTYDDVLRLANTAKGADRLGYRAELISLVEKARSLTTTASR